MLDYSYLVADDSFILFLDFFKAFDTVEHNFLYRSLQKFGFGNYFCKVIKTLYNNATCSIKLKSGSSPRFDIKRGIRQGCLISPYLFLLVAQLLCDHIKSSPLQGISIANRSIVISQLADDTTLFLKDSSQIPLAINIIKSFSKASGLSLNLKKCELLPIKSCDLDSLFNIPIKTSVTYLGIIISKSENDRGSLNFLPIIDKMKNRFNLWLLRDLSIKGRILLAKAEGLSRLIYAAQSLYVSNSTSKTVDKMLCNFIWRNRTHHIRKSVLMNDFTSGGLNFLDFSTLNMTFKIHWIRHFLKNSNSLWNFIPNYIFSQVGGLDFLLLCTYKPDKVPLKLSAYHKQMLLAWSMIYKHNFSPHRFYIWNNRYILYKNQTIFIQQWFYNNIRLVSQLFNQQGQLYTYTEFIQYYQIPVSVKDFSVVVDAIPLNLSCLFKETSTPSAPQLQLHVTDTTVGKLCFSTLKNPNKAIRRLFQQDITTESPAVTFWTSFHGHICWEKVWTLPNKYLLNNKVKEVSFKILHRFYPTNQYMSRLKRDIDKNCSFCGQFEETLIHMFWTCKHTEKIWDRLTNLIKTKIYPHFTLTWKNILCGFFNYDNKFSSEFYLINLLILLTKHYIHKTKFNNKAPNFLDLSARIRLYMQSISPSTNKKAIKTCHLTQLYNLM
uniref:Reverse transcriptase domain-containing protein n=1 Tax=Oryzias melastigma TaxID=30732 RepID=A0A3B3BAV7_ORYME